MVDMLKDLILFSSVFVAGMFGFSAIIRRVTGKR